MAHHRRYETHARAMREVTEYIEIFNDRQRQYSKFGYSALAVFVRECQDGVAA